MNRIQHPVRSPRIAPVHQGWDFGPARFSTVSRDVPHALFAPQHYEPGYAYPLIVWLHGPADDERQLLRIMPIVSLRNYVAVAPRGVPGRSPRKGRQKQPWLPWAGAASRAEQCVFDCISIAWQKYHISPKRIFVAGFDTGGTMAFHLALNYPDYFAGVLSFGGAFPIGRKPFRHLQRARRLAVLVAAGRDSTRYPPEKVCGDLRLLHSAGLSITLRQYPCRHELSPQMLQDMNHWVMDQIAHWPEQPAA